MFRLKLVGILFVLGLTYLVSDCQGQMCMRTNANASKKCVWECIPSMGCRSNRDSCLCDGDCGYSCVKKVLSCGEPLPKRLANGRRKLLNGTKFNSTVKFTCNSDFTLTGSSVRRCRASGVWDGEETKTRCRKYCADPGKGNFVLRDELPKQTGFKTKTILHYYCLPNFQLNGMANIVCMGNGDWSHPVPTCNAIPCPPPTLPDHSKVYRPKSFDLSKGRQFGTLLRLACNPGYYRLSDGQMRCGIGGHWDTTKSFKCRPRNCGDPGRLKNGERKGLLYTFKSKVLFQCDSCHKLEGPSYRLCGVNGKWSDTQPVCRRVQCRKPGVLGDGSINVISTDCGGRVVYSCNHGYTHHGPKERKCDGDGQWTGQEPNCTVVSCGLPLGPMSSGLQYKTNNAFTYGSEVTFTCKSGYTMEGANVTRCNADGSWSENPPRCLASCKLPVVLKSKKRTYDHGEKTAFKCVTGMVLSGLINTNKAHCDNGEWKYRVKKKEKIVKVDLKKIKCKIPLISSWNLG